VAQGCSRYGFRRQGSGGSGRPIWRPEFATQPNMNIACSRGDRGERYSCCWRFVGKVSDVVAKRVARPATRAFNRSIFLLHSARVEMSHRALLRRRDVMHRMSRWPASCWHCRYSSRQRPAWPMRRTDRAATLWRMRRLRCSGSIGPAGGWQGDSSVFARDNSTAHSGKTSLRFYQSGLRSDTCSVVKTSASARLEYHLSAWVKTRDIVGRAPAQRSAWNARRKGKCWGMYPRACRDKRLDAH